MSQRSLIGRAASIAHASACGAARAPLLLGLLLRLSRPWAWRRAS